MRSSHGTLKIEQIETEGHCHRLLVLLEFRAEAFNTFNHTNPGNPNTTLGNANYGKVTSAADPRILELALRLKF
jgi:hypothetical protein